MPEAELLYAYAPSNYLLYRLLNLLALRSRRTEVEMLWSEGLRIGKIGMQLVVSDEADEDDVRKHVNIGDAWGTPKGRWEQFTLLESELLLRQTQEILLRWFAAHATKVADVPLQIPRQRDISQLLNDAREAVRDPDVVLRVVFGTEQERVPSGLGRAQVLGQLFGASWLLTRSIADWDRRRPLANAAKHGLVTFPGATAFTMEIDGVDERPLIDRKGSVVAYPVVKGGETRWRTSSIDIELNVALVALGVRMLDNIYMVGRCKQSGEELSGEVLSTFPTSLVEDLESHESELIELDEPFAGAEGGELHMVLSDPSWVQRLVDRLNEWEGWRSEPD